MHIIVPKTKAKTEWLQEQYVLFFQIIYTMEISGQSVCK